MFEIIDRRSLFYGVVGIEAKIGKLALREGVRQLQDRIYTVASLILTNFQESCDARSGVSRSKAVTFGDPNKDGVSCYLEYNPLAILFPIRVHAKSGSEVSVLEIVLPTEESSRGWIDPDKLQSDLLYLQAIERRMRVQHGNVEVSNDAAIDHVLKV